MMAAVDDAVSDIHDAMSINGFLDNSLIVFTNDVSYHALASIMLI